MRHGYGVQIWPDGAKYEGKWRNNKAHGKGKFWHADGDVFDGEWKEDKAHGRGVYVHVNGAKYDGAWVDDLQEGYGVETWADGSHFEGHYKAGKKDGTGTYVWADGSQYSGQWVDNKINGKVSLHPTLRFRRGNTCGLMEEPMKDTGLTTICMAMEFILGRTAVAMRESTLTIRSTGKASTPGPTDANTSASGPTASSMARAGMCSPQVKRKVDFGRTERECHGIIMSRRSSSRMRILDVELIINFKL